MKSPFNIKDYELTQVGDNIYTPKTWLDKRVHESMKTYPNPYYEKPFIYKNINYDFEHMKNFIKAHEDEKDKIGIISTDDGVVLPKKNTNIRNTYNIIPSSTFINDYNRFFELQKKSIEKFFNISIMQSIEPQILVYKKGCFYKRHSDNCSEVLNPKKEIMEFKPVATQRVISTVLFLSSTKNIKLEKNSEFEFEGGELQFDYLYTNDFKKVKISPNEGDFISFLSNPYFSHSVKKIKSGTRISVVQWHNAIIH